MDDFVRHAAGLPLAPAAFALLYGMLTDRYGVTWIVGADTAPQGN